MNLENNNKIKAGRPIMQNMQTFGHPPKSSVKENYLGPDSMSGMGKHYNNIKNTQ